MRPTISLLRTCVSITAASLCFTLTAPAQITQVDLKTQTKGVDFSKAVATRPFKTGTALPSSCAAGEIFFKTDAVSGQNVFGCTAANTWTGETGGGLPAMGGNADRLLGTNGSQAGWVAIGGDLSGALQSVMVQGLQGRRVAVTTPTDGQVLRWNSTAFSWEPATPTGTGGTGGSTTTGGDLSGLVTSATVTRVQNKPVSSATPTDGQVLTWNQSNGRWQPQAPAGGSGGSSGGASSGASALSVSYSSPSTLTVGAGCSIAAPCNVRFGTNVIAMTAGATVTWQSGAGTAFIYVGTTGSITIGSNLTVACAGCVTASGISTFPANTIPLYTWNAISGGWDATGGRDARAYLASKIVTAGTGLLLVETGQQSTIGMDTTLIPTYTTGSGILSFGNVAAAACTADLAVPVPGALPGDAIAPGWPATVPPSLVGMMRVTTADVVSVRLCNMGNSAATVASASYRATVVRGL